MTKDIAAEAEYSVLEKLIQEMDELDTNWKSQSYRSRKNKIEKSNKEGDEVNESTEDAA